MAIFDWTGISAPFRIENGSVAKSTSVLISKDGKSPHIEESIRTIIKTHLGEFITKGHIGSKFRNLVFDSLEDDFESYITTNLIRAIEEEDPRVIVNELTINRYHDRNALAVVVGWDINPEVVENYFNENGDYITEIEFEAE